MEKIIKTSNNKTYTLDSLELELKNLKSLNETSKKILLLLSAKELYPKQIAKNLNLHEQNIYYNIRKLEEIGLIRVLREETINGTIAKFYSISKDSFYIKLKDFKETSKVTQKESSYFKEFIFSQKLDALIIVGSPDPHGPQKARSKDGYYGMDFALFLGTFLDYIDSSKVRLDTEVSNDGLKNNNLIVIGGPIVNKVMSEANNKLPIRFDENKKGVYSKLSKKIYYNDEIGYINKIKSPFNEKKQAIFIAGLRNQGTKAAILSFIKNFSAVKKPNLYNKEIYSKIVEGVDLDSDGIIDDVDVLE